MKEEDDLLKQAVTDYADQKRQSEPHPSDEVLVAFAEDGLAAVNREAILEHLSVCSDCTQTVSFLTDLEEGAQIPLEQVDVESAWSTFREKVEIDVSQTQAFPTSFFSDYQVWFAWAFVFCFPLWLSITVYQFTATKKEKVIANVKIIDVYPASQNQRSLGIQEEASANAEAVHLILHIEEQVSADTYSVEAVTCEGQNLWSSHDLSLSEHLNFTLIIPVSKMKGLCRLNLYSHHGRRKTQLATYEMVSDNIAQ